MLAFPWNPAALALTASTVLLQTVHLVTGYGASFLVVLLAALPALFWGHIDASRLEKKVAALLLVALPGLMIAYGAQRLRETPVDVWAGSHIRVVQASIPKGEKSTDPIKALIDHLNLSITKEQADQVTHLIWPETAFASSVEPNLQAFALLKTRLPKLQAIVTGAVRGDYKPDGTYDKYNSIVVVTADGKVGEHYDKRQLIPGIEGIPFGLKIPPSPNIHPDGVVFSNGANPAPALNIPGLPPALPLICFEVVFPHLAREVQGAPQWMLVVSNDGWLGDSIGPAQHFETTRLRAVELGLPLIRAANNGISAFIDPYGRVLKKMGMNEKGVLE